MTEHDALQAIIKLVEADDTEAIKRTAKGMFPEAQLAVRLLCRLAVALAGLERGKQAVERLTDELHARTTFDLPPDRNL